MKQLFTLSAFLIFGFSAFAQKHYERLATMDVQHYRFELTITDASDELNAIAHVKIKFNESLTNFSLDLVERSGKKGMEVIAVMSDNKALNFAHEGGALRITDVVEAGSLKDYLIAYKGVPETGLIISKNKYGERTFFGDNWPDRARHWLPTVDHPADKATVEWVITAPSHYQVIGNGRLQERTSITDELTLTHWASRVPLPTKVMVFGAARFATQTAGDIYGIPISSWVYPQDREKGFYDYALAVTITDWFINHVGPFPFAKLANVQSKTQFGGMENASAIFYSENSVKGDRSAEALIAHEIAHQWFGNSASEANWHHVWLSEGFATYFTNLYMEHQYGKEELRKRVQEQRRSVLNYAKEKRVPIVNPAIEQYMELLNANSYQKGGWVLHMLRKKVGDETFWKAMRTYYQRYTLSNAYTADLKEVVEQISGVDLDPFFNQWVMQAGQPELDVEWSYKDRTLDVNFRQLQQEDFAFELEVDIVYQDGSKERRTITIDQKLQQWKPKVNSEPAQLILDPDSWLLFEATLSKK